jgi:geranylgeranyl diphosphate synthase type I
MSLQAYMHHYLPLIEQELGNALSDRSDLPGYYGMMRYHMGWMDAHLQPISAPQGKRMRPVLCLLACEAVGGTLEQALPAAAAIELVHNFSLIHDDIEDQSLTRRHRETVWAVWGSAQGINCGDGMYTTAWRELGELAERGVSPERALHAQRVLCETCLTLTEGQYLDMSFENQENVSLDSYIRMISCKSAALIACSACLGSYLGGGDDRVVGLYRDFGENLGLAFQVIDDLLGIWGAEDVTGKSVSTDILSRKKTLPVLYAIGDPELQAIYAQETLEQGDVERVVQILEACGARNYAEEVARGYSDQAVRCLQETGIRTPAQQAIAELTDLLLRRTA